MAEWVRWQLDFGRLQRSQVQAPAEPKLFCIFSKIVEIFIKNTFLGVKMHEGHESGVKKISTPRKTLWNWKNWFQRVFRWVGIFLMPDSCSSRFFTPRNMVFIKISSMFEKMQKISGSAGVWTCDFGSTQNLNFQNPLRHGVAKLFLHSRGNGLYHNLKSLKISAFQLR